MAQDAFRRFAAEVVAPQAEAIHRHDLTVPESLLEPLREMGVFGLSIPERYGGSRSDDHDDTPMMLVVTEALSEASLAAAGSLITRPEILARALLAGGTEAQRDALAAADRRRRAAVRDRHHRARLRLRRRQPRACARRASRAAGGSTAPRPGAPSPARPAC